MKLNINGVISTKAIFIVFLQVYFAASFIYDWV